MREKRPFITIELDLTNPIELVDFVSFFGALSNQFERYVKQHIPNAESEARFFVQEVRKGSIIAELLNGENLDHAINNAKTLIAFTELIAEAIKIYMHGGRTANAGDSDLKDYLNTVKAIAKDPKGKATISTSSYEQGLLSKKVSFTFSTPEARNAVNAIEAHRTSLAKTQSDNHERVLMIFRRPDRENATLGKRSGERVVIEALSLNDLPVVYASELAEKRIKHILREADGNIFKKGFVVSVNVETRNGKPIAYRITDMHDVIDIDDEENS
ncbi:hypothetical protein [Ferrovibrio sp.]|uniref:hypothetical protein n=1 Tax=Ferrovibrio sp. TaxID=1917215 RepID=UPI0035AF86B1